MPTLKANNLALIMTRMGKFNLVPFQKELLINRLTYSSGAIMVPAIKCK